MTERALVSAPSGAHGGDSDAQSHTESRAEGIGNPAIRMLDALGVGDERAVLASLSQTTTVAAENMPWGCRGPDEVGTALREARERFPGLTYEPHTRHVGFGLVIEEARVRDLTPPPTARTAVREETAHPELEDPDAVDAGSQTPVGPGTELEPYDEEIAARSSGPDLDHPMWDNVGPASRMTALAVWHENLPALAEPTPLDLPVRITVRHDDLQVHEVTVSFPAPLWKRALGQQVDPRDVSLSEVQAAFIAPTGVGFTTHELAPPVLADLAHAPESAAAGPAPAIAQNSRRRRRRWLPALLLTLAILVVAGWWLVRDTTGTSAVGAGTSTSATPVTDPGQAQPVAADDSTQASEPPTVTRVHTASAPHREPTVTLKSDLAFGFDSSSLSAEAKLAVAALARQIHRSGLAGTIYVDGYTDDLGSSAHGTLLSQRRADAVSAYLQSHLLGAPVRIVSAGHGEQSPIASNATASGRQQNRRVTITLPQP